MTKEELKKIPSDKVNAVFDRIGYNIRLMAAYAAHLEQKIAAADTQFKAAGPDNLKYLESECSRLQAENQRLKETRTPSAPSVQAPRASVANLSGFDRRAAAIKAELRR